jgi:hypothetical protein
MQGGFCITPACTVVNILLSCPQMKTFAKVIIVTISILALLFAATLCFFAFTYQWAVTWYALLLFIPLLVAAVLVTLFIVYFFRRNKWRWGFASIGIALVLLAYTGLILWNYSYMVFHEPANNPVFTLDTDENRILTKWLSENMSIDKYYVVIAPDNDDYGYFKDKTPQEFNGYKSRLIDEYKKSNKSDNATLQNLSGLFDKFIELNRQPWSVSIKSSLRDGYYINYEDTFNKYLPGGFPVSRISYRKIHYDFKLFLWDRPRLDGFDIFGWEDWRLYGRDFRARVDISLPVYDKDTGLFMIYMGWNSGGLMGTGDIFLFKYDNNNLNLISKAELWVS